MRRAGWIAALALCLAAPLHAAGDARLSGVLARWDHDAHPDLNAVVVMKDGRIVAERYYNGDTADTLHDVRSAGKSITSLLVGIAIDRGYIKDVDQPVAAYWPQANGSAIGDVPIRDVLTMRSGLAAFDDDPASPGNEDKLDAAADPLLFLLGVPRATAPGTTYRYNSLTAYTAGLVVAKATGKSLADFARTTLFAPLGITQWRWASDGAGVTKGQGNLSIRARDFARIGEMVRDHGYYRGRRIVSARWLDQALSAKVTISDSDPYADSYGYFWYRKLQEVDGKRVSVSFASGNGGNKIYVVPSGNLVVAITSSAYGHGYGQRRSEEILKAILAER